ncbi:hypothetical protein [Ectothiorhodospira shaposhnikovii]|uniref:hypothetical protein n=1 Tax=Ectothiorhodospira shaposhnikovii TaxID=1054 RepID=UPI001EE79F14|nr:hypothetical protein [Ectothiorhodospira shaposhnikovii]MCG5512782.1 hypothetical protein [Ectothiorhodospira shaposhnikovii]
MELVRNKKAAIQAQSGRRANTVKPTPGKSKWRILPGWRGESDPQFYHDFSQHFVKGVDGSIKAVYLCVEKTFGKMCPVCEAINGGISKAGSDEIINALKEAKSKGRVLLNALHLDGEDPSAPVILDLTPGTFEKILEVMEQYGDEGINILDLKEGVDLVINRTGKGLNTEYSVMAAVKSNPVDPAVLKKLHNLDEYVQQEYKEGETKALSAVATVSGLALAAPAVSPDKPTTPALPSDFDDDLPFELDGATAAPAPAAARPTVTVAATVEASEDDLEALLGDLENV